MRFWPRSRQSIVRSFYCAFRGLRFAFEGRNFVLTILIGLFVLGLSYIFGLSTQDRFTIIISTGTILGAEIFNSAMEQILDIVVPDHDPRVGRAKDLLAAGVLMFSIIAGVIWLRLFLKAILGWSI